MTLSITTKNSIDFFTQPIDPDTSNIKKSSKIVKKPEQIAITREWPKERCNLENHDYFLRCKINKTATQMIQDPERKDNALFAIVEKEILHDISGAKQTAEMIQDLERKDNALFAIVEKEVLHDISGAKQTAEMIQDSERKDNALFTIVEKEVLHDISGASLTAKMIQDPERQDKALLMIVERKFYLISQERNRQQK